MPASLLRRSLLLELALEGAGVRGELGLARLGEERVEPAPVLDRAQRVRGDAKPDRALQRVGLKRDVHEIGQELALGLAVRVAHEMAREHGLAGQFAAARHGLKFPTAGTAAERSRIGA